MAKSKCDVQDMFVNYLVFSYVLDFLTCRVGWERGWGYSPQLTIQLCATLKSMAFGPVWSGYGYTFCLRSLDKSSVFTKNL